MSTAKNKRPALDNTELRRLKGIGHELKPVVTIGNKGLSDSVVEELDRALNDHELIKIKTPPGTKEEREVFSSDLAEKTGAQLIHSHRSHGIIITPQPPC